MTKIVPLAWQMAFATKWNLVTPGDPRSGRHGTAAGQRHADAEKTGSEQVFFYEMASVS